MIVATCECNLVQPGIGVLTIYIIRKIIDGKYYFQYVYIILYKIVTPFADNALLCLMVYSSFHNKKKIVASLKCLPKLCIYLIKKMKNSGDLWEDIKRDN